MPTEILYSIIVELTIIDNEKRDSLRSLALVSWKMNDRAIPELFRTKLVACRRDAMDSLMRVSNSDRLRHHVKHLIVDINFSASYNALEDCEFDNEQEWKEEREHLKLYCEHLVCQQNLFRSNAGNTVLVHCLETDTSSYGDPCYGQPLG